MLVAAQAGVDRELQERDSADSWARARPWARQVEGLEFTPVSCGPACAGARWRGDDCLFHRGISRHHWRMRARRRASPVERALASHRQGEPAVQCHVLLRGRHGLDPGAALSNLVDRRTRSSAQVEHHLRNGVLSSSCPGSRRRSPAGYPCRWLIALTVAVHRVVGSQPDPALLELQLAGIERIETKLMPWGEPFASPVGPLAPSFWFAIAAALVVLGDSMIRFLASWRRDRSGASMMMVLSTAVYFVCRHRRHSGSRADHRLHTPGSDWLFRHGHCDEPHAELPESPDPCWFPSSASGRWWNSRRLESRYWRSMVERSRSIRRGNASGARTHRENPRVADESLLPVIERAFQGHKGETNPMPTRG